MVKHIPYDTYPAVILFLALLGVYTKEVSFIISSVGILVLHFIIDQWNSYESWTFLAAVIVWVVIWNAYYYGFVKTSQLEHFESVTTRPCNIYFTKFQKACDDGTFYKDTKYLEIERDTKLRSIENSLQQKQSQLNEIDDSLSIANAAILNVTDPTLRIWRDPNRSILVYLTKRLDLLILQEQAKGSEQDMALIASLTTQKKDIAKRVSRIAALTYTSTIKYVDQRTWKIDVSARDKKIQEARALILRDINILQTQINKLKASQDYKDQNAIINEIKSGVTRCKNTYNGWVEPSSTGNMDLYDPIKNTTSEDTKIRGDPYTWAHCYQQNNSMDEWSKKQAYFETKKSTYRDISYATKPIPIGSGNGVGSNQFTGRISFNKLSPSDMAECDDNMIIPNYPVIPNGLLEIKIDESDIIQSMRRIMYKDKDTRFIDPVLTKNIGDVDNKLLRDIFYMDGIDIILQKPINAPIGWTPSIQFFLMPNKNIRYDVYYLYVDKKCGDRFYGNTTKDGIVHPKYRGPSKVGDLLGYNSSVTTAPVPSKISFPDASITDPEIVNYIITYVGGFNSGRRNVSLLTSTNINYISILQDRRNYLMNTTVTNLNARIPGIEANIKVYQDAYERLKTAGLCSRPYISNWCNWYNYVANIYVGQLNSVKKEIDRITRISNGIQSFINVVNARTNDVSAGAVLQSYIGKPVTQFVKGYNPSYLSNKRTMYLKITALSSRLQPVVFLHDKDSDVVSKQLSQIPNITFNDIFDDNTTYETATTFDESEFENLGITAAETEKEFTITTPTLPAPPAAVDVINPIVTERFEVEDPYTVKVYDIERKLLKSYTSYNIIDTITQQPIYKKVYYITINKGITIRIYNSDNIVNTYTNSNKATTPLEITLNSTMTGVTCDRKKSCKNYLQRIYITRSTN